MRSSLLEDLHSFVKSSQSKLEPLSLPLSPHDINSDLSQLNREYDKRIRLLEEEIAKQATQKLSDDIIKILSQHGITVEHIETRLYEVTRDQLLREKENAIKTLLTQIAYYKQQLHKNLVSSTIANENSLTAPPSYYPI